MGSWLLLHLPEKVFEKVVPVLLVLALGLVVVGPRIQEWARDALRNPASSPEHVSGRRMAALVFGTFVIGIYGGYFTAAQGIMLIAAMSALLPEDMQRMNAAKNLLSLLVNIVAAVAYTVVAFDRISWAAAGLIAVGFADRRVPRRALRTAAVAERAASRDRDGRRHRAVSAGNHLGLGRRRSAVGFRPAAGDPGSTAGCGAVW